MQLLINTAISAGYITLAALGFRLVYTTTRFFHFAHAASITVGAYAAWTGYMLGANIVSAIFLGTVIASITGAMIFALLIRPFAKRQATPLSLLLASLAVLIVIQHIVALYFGDDARSIQPDQGTTVISIGSGYITSIQVVIITSAITVSLLLKLLGRFSIFGKQQLAVAEHKELSLIYGINTGRIEVVVLLMASAIGGLLGVLVGFDLALSPDMGITWLLPGVIAVIVGGIHRLEGVIIACIGLAIIKTLTIWYLGSTWQDVLLYFILFAYFIIKPEGLTELKGNT